MLNKLRSCNLVWKGKYVKIILILSSASFLFILYHQLVYDKNILNSTSNYGTLVGYYFDSDKTTKSYKTSDTTSSIRYNKMTSTSSKPDIQDESVLSNATSEYLRNIIKCNNKDYISRKYKQGEYWIFENYVKANHGDLECHQHVTLATHGGFSFLDNLEITVRRWLGPISVVIYTPGTDFSSSLDSIRYLRQCSPQKALIKQWVTFHFYFTSDHFPQQMPKMNEGYNCTLPPPYYTIFSNQTYRSKNKLTYPINIARNLAKNSALTHYILSVDIEMYPSPSLGIRFLNMLARNSSLVQDKKRRVFVTKPFEIAENQEIPLNKTSLLKMLHNKTVVTFHTHVCPLCHDTPLPQEWIDQGETAHMDITGKCNRTGKYSQWEAVFICTKDDPQYEDKLSWEGMRDKMSQSYLICVLGYEILILSNAFLVHHPPIHHSYPISSERWGHVGQQTAYIDKVLHKEYDMIFGNKTGCVL